jgi:Type III restriction enzyme, res subunit/Helicase C-terminal domain
MAFKKRIRSNVSIESPIALFRDLRNRKVKGLLDHQSKMLEIYQKEFMNEDNIAMELPTGSGKTLVGLLIAEYRRRVNNEKIVYLCPTKQLVNQVVEESKEKYGIKTVAFTGKQSEYDPISKAEYNRAKTIAVTTYSSLFNTNTFFSNPDVIILDDAHAAENYIASYWSLSVKRKEYKQLYLQIIESIKGSLSHGHYQTMVADSPLYEETLIIEKLPTEKFYEHLNDLTVLLDGNVGNTNLQYPWSVLRSNLEACHLYISWSEILIRPIIPPSLTHEPFANAKQRIFMSATLGNSGDLERMVGIPKIKRFPIPEGWDKQGLGRRLFFFPETIMQEDEAIKFSLEMTKQVERALILVPDEKTREDIESLAREITDKDILTSRDLEVSRSRFTENENAIAILANRLDGIDLADDQCRLLILIDIPRATHLQERFLMSRMAASVLFHDRVRARIIQAVGRCTRSPVDYAAVCIIGQELTDELVENEKIKLFHPELQAEIIFGHDQSMLIKDKEEFLENLKIFLEHEDEWNAAEEEIFNERESRKQEILGASKKLLEAAQHEFYYHYALWQKNYDKAMESISKVVSILSGDDVKGYRGFWYYLAGSTAWLASKDGITSYAAKVGEYYNKAAKCTNVVPWLNKLANITNREENENYSDTYVLSLVEGLEAQLDKLGISSDRKFEQFVADILNALSQKENGNLFEKGHEMLGCLLGYNSGNTEETSGPDPWWIVDNKICIVSEDKLYEQEDKRIPVKHVQQVTNHPTWIRKKLINLEDDCKIVPIMITTARYIDRDAVTFADNVLYWNYDEFLRWAISAIDVIRRLRQRYSGPGNPNWRNEAVAEYKKYKLTPLEIINSLKDSLLKNLPN